MTKHGFPHSLVLLTFVAAATCASHAYTFDVVTLKSPNEHQFGAFGQSVSGAGDFNRDGFADVIVGAGGDGRSPNHTGRAYVFSGRDHTLLVELESPNPQAGGFFGLAVANAGDVNRDGFPDLAVGAPREYGYVGAVYVFSGDGGTLLQEIVAPHAYPAGLFGERVAGAGDINQDGFADLVVSAREGPGGPYQGGRAYLFSGRDGGLLLELVSPHEEIWGEFGTSGVSAAGDVDLDGFADVIVGAGREDPGTCDGCGGRAYIFSGRNGSVIFELASPNEGYSSGGGFGGSVAGLGDVNGDGFADVIVGASGEDPGLSPEDAGRAHVFSGQDGSPIFEFASPSEDYLQGGGFGGSVAGAGDIDQDGFVDVIVGAPGERADARQGHYRAGRAYVFSGEDWTLLVKLVSPNEQRLGVFGWAVSGVGDTNKDGCDDVVVGAAGEDPGPSPMDAGRAYLALSGAEQTQAFINAGGPNYTDSSGTPFVADRAYSTGGFGYVGGREHRSSEPIGGTNDDRLYQDLRLAREGERDGKFSYRFDVSAVARFDVTLHLTAPALSGTGNVVMDVQAEGDLVFDNLDVTAEGGGEYQALIKKFAVDVRDGTLDLEFWAVHKAAVVSAIAVVPQTP
jgi:hypothetical protein